MIPFIGEVGDTAKLARIGVKAADKADDFSDAARLGVKAGKAANNTSDGAAAVKLIYDSEKVTDTADAYHAAKVDGTIEPIHYDADDLIAELEENNVKFTKEDIVFITKDRTGQTVWLEKGKPSAGLEHILNGDGQTSGHISDFKRALGISKDEIPDYLKKVISNGKVVSNKIVKRGLHDGYERVYYYEGNYYILTGIGTNGFVITAYPRKRRVNNDNN